ncbi:MAG: type II toxin-antitoxin system HipA family toxin [Thermodesulfobacteriota bacterium]|nr:type II toxin-antitoxin system HipA family toxin [Thermodesulfobacteriota bacterium]
MDELDVYLNKLKVGVLTSNAGILAFSYHHDYQQLPMSLPLSRYLPLNRTGANFEFGDSATRAFFENLLPEGDVRTQLVRKLGLSRDNIFALLATLGGDCAGAVQLLPSGQDPKGGGSYRLISTAALAVELESLPAHPFLAANEGVRLSLAGAQNKLPVHYDGNNFFIPTGDSASTYILKTPIKQLENTVVNEAFCMTLAGRVGLQVPVAIAINVGEGLVYQVKRYDRREIDGDFIRLHQEDFCQALGVESACKYEKEGGPGFAECFALLRDWSDEPLADVAALLRWSLFNFLIGNADAHGKNISFLYADGQIRLAPFYDLLSTAVYERLINNKFAMRMGGQKDPRYFSATNLTKFATEVGIGLRVVKRELAGLITAIELNAPLLATEYRQQYANAVIVGRLEQVLAQRIVKAKSILGEIRK